ncbi:alpha/beta fold hydrolase [Methanobacterium alkalithermotolerans]|uniref:Alpha/beta fold hydrolase n=1 Tax=Methanobacterium alkalithermotolerans TaxID=2731220 RepID=A0A8T8K6Z8_9EURY|nr:alpha/beta fold hydrolase [Methanobacterium alkalithermotolerans]QUH23807.1 alpha/beta fold hydrolase [Methanobacterium alkalithermotolerans]
MIENLEAKYYELNNFRFESGEILSSLRVEYCTLGTPIKDEEGHITNAIVYLHGWSGDYSSIKRLKDIIGPGKALDTNKYYLISPSALGSPKSAAPSNSSRGFEFPRYSVNDMVNFLYSFLKENFSIKHLKGVIGNSMGGFQALTWGVLYPDFMDFIIPLVSSYQSKGWNFAIFHYMNSLIEQDPDYNQGNYVKNPRITSAASQFMYLFGLSRDYYESQVSNQDIINSMAEMGQEGLLSDANDIYWRNKAAMAYNLKGELDKIKAKTMVIAINQDQYFPPEYDAIPLSREIKDSQLVIYDSPLGHVGSHEIVKIEKEIGDFLTQF